MSQNVVPLNAGARSYTGKQLSLIRRTVAKDCTPDEFDMFMEVSRRAGLDPFRKQIHALVFNKDRPDKRQMSIITGIDGYRAIAARCGDYRPGDRAPVIEYDETLKDPATNPLGIVRAEVTGYKLGPDGQWHAVVAEAYWEEYAPLKEVWEYSDETKKREPTGRFELAKGNWRTMGRLMIVKCAEALMLRKGWPEALSGLYASEEMDRAVVQDANASETVAAHEETLRLQRVHAADTISMLWRAGDPIEQVPLGQMHDRCVAFIQASESPTGLEAWQNINHAVLQEFWARAKADALDVKKALESRMTELREG